MPQCRQSHLDLNGPPTRTGKGDRLSQRRLQVAHHATAVKLAAEPPNSRSVPQAPERTSALLRWPPHPQPHSFAAHHSLKCSHYGTATAPAVTTLGTMLSTADLAPSWQDCFAAGTSWTHRSDRRFPLRLRCENRPLPRLRQAWSPRRETARSPVKPA